MNPNPAETVWTLGIGGAPVFPAMAQGKDLLLATVLMNDGVAVNYTGGTLAASAWKGQNLAVAITPTMTATSPSTGVLTLAIPASATASIESGIYRMQCSVTVSGLASIFYDGVLLIGFATQSATVRTPYVTVFDLQAKYDQLQTLQNNLNDTTGFLAIRVLESNLFDRRIILRYTPRPGFVLTRQNTLDSIVGMDVALPAAVPPSKFAITTALTAGGLIVEQLVIDQIARRVIAEVLIRQPVKDPMYRQQAAEMLKVADDLWMCYQAQISLASPPTSTADVLIDMDVVLLPAGTSP